MREVDDRLAQQLRVVGHRYVPEPLEVAQLAVRDQALEAASLAREQDHVARAPEDEHRAGDVREAGHLQLHGGVERAVESGRVREQLELLDHLVRVGAPRAGDRWARAQGPGDRVAQQRLGRRRIPCHPAHAEQDAARPVALARVEKTRRGDRHARARAAAACQHERDPAAERVAGDVGGLEAGLVHRVLDRVGQPLGIAASLSGSGDEWPKPGRSGARTSKRSSSSGNIGRQPRQV